MNEIRLIEIGIGPHAKRAYVPALQEWGALYGAQLCLAVDLQCNEEATRQYFDASKLGPDLLFVEPFKGELPPALDEYLSRYVVDNRVRGVIISTEPLCHYAYAKWALRAGLDILMDKPIVTHENVTASLENAKRIEDDYLDLLHSYQELQRTRETVFTVNVQRRYHPGFEAVNGLLAEMAEKMNCPVTAVQSMHCDGQWRLPSEIVTQDYHPYNSGYGKASHSGYHLFDAVYQFYQHSRLTGKVADSMEVFASFVQPRGLLLQLNEGDYRNFFGGEYADVKQYSDRQLWELYQDFGEVDVSAIIRLLRNGENVGNVTINLLHNGFARRTWVRPGNDLYKGNGRVKHEYHNIQQGPFQNVQVHSYQSKDNHATNGHEDDYLGGNNHFDVYAFRNMGMTGDAQPMSVFGMADLKQQAGTIRDDKLAVEQVKHRVVVEFLRYMQGEISRRQLRSNIDDHLVPVRIMSGIYQSHNLHLRGENPVVKYEVEL